MLFIGVSIVLMMGASLDGLRLREASAADDGGGSTIPIPPPERPTPSITDVVPSATPTSPGGTVVPTVAGTPGQEPGPGSSLALWFGAGLGSVGLVGLAAGGYIIFFSQRRRGGA